MKPKQISTMTQLMLIYSQAANALKENSMVPGLVCLRLGGYHPSDWLCDRTLEESFWITVYRLHFMPGGN